MFVCLYPLLDGIPIPRRLSPQYRCIVTRHVAPDDHQPVLGILVLRIEGQDFQESILGLAQMTALQ